MKSYLLFILLSTGNMHSMEFATYKDCVQAQKELQSVIGEHKGFSQCLAKGSVIEDGIDKTKNTIGSWLNEKTKKYNETE